MRRVTGVRAVVAVVLTVPPREVVMVTPGTVTAQRYCMGPVPVPAVYRAPVAPGMAAQLMPSVERCH